MAAVDIQTPSSWVTAHTVSASVIKNIGVASLWLTAHTVSASVIKNIDVASLWLTAHTVYLGTNHSISTPSTWDWNSQVSLISDHSMAIASVWRTDNNVSLSVIKVGLTVCDVIRDILLCWGIEHPCAAPQMALTAALNILNNGMQVLWNQAKDRNYWTQSTIEVTFTSGVSTAVLSNDIQNVIGPARLTTGQPLIPLANISESETFSDAFLENSAPTTPVGYFIERNNQSGADPVKCTIIISPAPTASTTVKLDVVNESPRYTILDIDSCPVCPVPHKYVESILMPVCRYLSMHSYLFSNRDREKAIVAAYADARKLLDVADPLPGQSGENIGYRKEERDKS
jgi:hypothetical protein